LKGVRSLLLSELWIPNLAPHESALKFAAGSESRSALDFTQDPNPDTH